MQSRPGNISSDQLLEGRQGSQQEATRSSPASRPAGAASSAVLRANEGQQRQKQQQQQERHRLDSGVVPRHLPEATPSAAAEGHQEGPALKRPRYDVAPAADGYPSETQQQQQRMACWINAQQEQHGGTAGVTGRPQEQMQPLQQHQVPPGLPQIDSNRDSHLQVGDMPLGLHPQGVEEQQAAAGQHAPLLPQQQQGRPTPLSEDPPCPTSTPTVPGSSGAAAAAAAAAVPEGRQGQLTGVGGEVVVAPPGPSTSRPDGLLSTQPQQPEEEEHPGAAGAAAAASDGHHRARPLTHPLLPAAPAVSGTAGASGPMAPRTSSCAAAAVQASHPSAAAAVGHPSREGHRGGAASPEEVDSDEVQQPSPRRQQQADSAAAEREGGLDHLPEDAAPAEAEAIAAVEAAVRAAEQGAAGPSQRQGQRQQGRLQPQDQRQQQGVPGVGLPGPEPVVADNEVEVAVRPPPVYHSRQRPVQVWLHLQGVTPATLPPDLQPRLRDWLGVIPYGLVPYLWPPGLIVSLHLLLDQTVAEQLLLEGLRRLLNLLLRDPASDPYWRTGSWWLQLGGRLAVLREGVPVSYMDCSPSVAAAGQLPVLLQLEQVAYRRLPAGEGGQREEGPAAFCTTATTGAASASCAQPSQQQQQQQRRQQGSGAQEQSITLRLRGRNLGRPNVMVVVKGESQYLFRGRGRLVAVAAVPPEAPPAGPPQGAGAEVAGEGAQAAAAGAGGQEGVWEPGATDVLEVVVGVGDLGPGPKLLWVEVGSSMYHSEALPLLLVEEEELVAEVNHVNSERLMPQSTLTTFLVDLALVMQYTSGSTVSSLGTGLPREEWDVKRPELAVLADAQGWEAVAAAARAPMQRPDAAPAAAAAEILARQQAAAAGAAVAGVVPRRQVPAEAAQGAAQVSAEDGRSNSSATSADTATDV